MVKHWQGSGSNRFPPFEDIFSSSGYDAGERRFDDFHRGSLGTDSLAGQALSWLLRKPIFCVDLTLVTDWTEKIRQAASSTLTIIHSIAV